MVLRVREAGLGGNVCRRFRGIKRRPTREHLDFECRAERG